MNHIAAKTTLEIVDNAQISKRFHFGRRILLPKRLHRPGKETGGRDARRPDSGPLSFSASSL